MRCFCLLTCLDLHLAFLFIVILGVWEIISKKLDRRTCRVKWCRTWFRININRMFQLLKYQPFLSLSLSSPTLRRLQGNGGHLVRVHLDLVSLCYEAEPKVVTTWENATLESRRRYSTSPASGIGKYERLSHDWFKLCIWLVSDISPSIIAQSKAYQNFFFLRVCQCTCLVTSNICFFVCFSLQSNKNNWDKIIAVSLKHPLGRFRPLITVDQPQP